MLIEVADPSQKIPFSYQELSNPDLLDYANTHLPTEGILKVDNVTNYSYLKIADDYILKLFPFLSELDQDLKQPEYFSEEKNFIGAHITVAYADEVNAELIKQDIIQLEKESGLLTIHFNIKRLLYIQAFEKKIIILTVFAPALEEMREKHKLSYKLNYNGLLVPFHITVALG